MAHFATEPRSPLLLPVPDNPTQTCISRDAFRKLPFELQWDYAIHYELPDAAHLTSDNICHMLCTRNKWIPAIAGQDHIRYPTSKGVIVGKDVMEIIDRLVEEGTDNFRNSHNEDLPQFPITALEYPPTPQPQFIDDGETSNQGINAPEWLSTMIDDLEQTNERVKDRILNTRRSAREAAADVLEFKAKMATDVSYRASVMHTISDNLGTTTARVMEERVIDSTREGVFLVPLSATNDDQPQLDRNGTYGFDESNVATRSSPRETNGVPLVPEAPTTLRLSSLPDSNPIPHLPYSLTSAVEAHTSVSQNIHPTPTHVQFSTPTRQFSQPARKRAHEDAEEKFNAAHHQPAESSNTTSDSPHRAKRARQDVPIPNSMALGVTETRMNNEIRWCDYPSDDEPSGDTSSYSPSVGTDEEYIEDDYIDVEASLRFLDKRLKRRQRIVASESSDSSSGLENYASEEGIRWNACPSDEDETDSSYSPGSWDLEHILEITTEGRYSHDYYENMDTYNYMDELLEFGPMSDSSLGTDDDRNYKDVSHFRPSELRLSESLFHHRSAPIDYPKRHRIDSFTGNLVVVDDPARRKMQAARHKWYRWTGLLQNLKNPEWVKCDVNERIAEMAISDGHSFEFDEEEWKFFEETIFP